MANGVKTVLGDAVSAHRAEDAQGDAQGDASPQGDLFALSAPRTELDLAVEAARSDAEILEQAWLEAEQRRQREPARQPLGQPVGEALELEPPGPRGPGRPKGARNLKTEEAARYYTRRHGDPLEQAVKLGAIPILAAGVLEALARRLGSTRLEAAKFWLANNQAVMPFIRPRLGSLEIRPAGSPESDDAVTWDEWNYIDGQLVDNTVSEPKAITARETAAEIEPGE